MGINRFSILFLSAVSAICLQVNNSYAQCQGAKDIAQWGTFDNWRVREIKESGMIGGNIKYSYEIAKGDTLKGAVPYINPAHCVWSTSNVLAIVKGVTKVSCTVFPEKRGNGYCARMETRIEKVKVMGIMNMNVIAAGTIYLGQMLEPIKDTKNPQAKLNTGIPFTDKPLGIMFDYKVITGHNRVKASGLGSPKTIGDDDYAECVVILQKRWEDESGNVYAKRVGTAYKRFCQTDTVWQNNHKLDIHYGDITKESYYQPYMKLIPEELANYTINSKGASVPIREIEWADKDDTPTHIIIRFSSSHGEAYVGDTANRLWIDNVKMVY